MGCFGAATRVEGGKTSDQLPCKDRSIRDVPCLIILALFLIGGLIAVLVAFSESSLHRLLHGYDNYGNVCGQSNPQIPSVPQSGQDFSEEKVLLLFDGLSSEDKTLAFMDYGVNGYHLLNRTCVSQCPATGGELVINYCFFNGAGSQLLTNQSSEPILSLVSRDTAMPVSNYFEEVSRDIETAWPELVAICAVAFGLAVTLLALFRFFAWVIVYVVIVIVVIGAVAGTGFLWYLYQAARDAADTSDETVKRFREQDATTMLVMAIFATIFTVILLIVLFTMRKRIKLVTALFTEAGKAIQDMPLLLLQPLYTFFVMVVAISIWLLAALAIESMGEPVPAIHSGFVQYRKETVTVFFRYYNLFAMFWISQFIIGCQDMVVAGAVSKWFFTRDKSKLDSPILTALKNLVLYHLGSVALGSFVIAVVKLIRALLKKLQTRMAGNPVVKAVCCCCQCCIWCFEKFLQFLNRNAYVEITIHGYNFCKAAQQAFTLLARNALRVAAINSIGAFVMFLGRAAVTISTVFIGIEIMKGRPDVTHSYIVIAIGGLFAYLISYVFVSIYEMAIDTLFVCFCEDCDLNDGVSKPYFMSKGLMEFVENSKKALAAMKHRKSQTTPIVFATTKPPQMRNYA